MFCVITRFHLKRFWHLALFFLAFRRMKQDLNTAPGLIRYAFLLEGSHICYTFSIWESEVASMTFNNTSMHIRIMRKLRPLCHAIWSADWRMCAISKSAHQWDGPIPWPPMISHVSHPNRLVPSTEKGEDHDHP